jgi:hypothetical protein
MKDIICVGGSNTSFRRPDERRFYKGYCPDTNDMDCGNGSYPEAIHRNFRNKVYNLGVAGNTIEACVLSVISFSSKLLKEGNNNFSIIFNCPDFYRKSFYLSDSMRKIKNIKDDLINPINNNYLFTNTQSGFLLVGGIQNVSKTAYSDDNLYKIAKVYSEHLFSFEQSEINAITHLLLFQNFCKANNISYKIFFDFDFVSSPNLEYFDLDTTNEETYFKSYFLDKKLIKKEPLGYIKHDEFVYDLFKMLDLNEFWFYKDENVEYGGIHEWLFKNNEYKEGDDEYIAFFFEDIEMTAFELKDRIIKLKVDRAKQKMKEGKFFNTAHPTYYYWEKFVKDVMIHWDLF